MTGELRDRWSGVNSAEELYLVGSRREATRRSILALKWLSLDGKLFITGFSVLQYGALPREIR